MSTTTTTTGPLSLPLAGGNVSYAAEAGSIKARLDSSIPSSLRLPASTLSNLPLDVTGIPQTCGLLSASELAITELDATALRDKIAAGELTAVEAVTAFGKRAAVAHQVVNCLTEFFLDEGIEQAKALDAHFKKHGQVVGPLHGVPISVKDHMPIKGHYSSAGFLSTNELSKEDCHMIKILRDLGAVFYVKTNQPQGIMHLETHSFYGRTLNPYNRGLTPGGSSGGEGALNALRGSCLGLGTDIGGSIRNPAAQCGIYGMRPSSKTMPMAGYLWYMDGNDGVFCSTGPMCRSARDIDMFISAVRGTQPALKDPVLIPLPWSVPEFPGKKLRVGIMMHDGVVVPQPPMLRALEMAKKKLEGLGDKVEVVEYKPFKHQEGYDIIRELYFEDGGKTVRKLLANGGEDALSLTDFVLAPPYTKDHDALGLWELHDRRDQYRQAYSDDWNAQGCDVVLCPPYPGAANEHDTARYWSYTALWNHVDYPGVVFPSGLQVDPALDKVRTDFQPLSEADEQNNALFNPEKMVGAPISLQLVARRFNDCSLLAALKVVEEALRA